MATPKRRKVETSEGSRPMSAFALRQQLLSASPSLSPAPQAESQPAPDVQVSTPTPTPKVRSPAKGRSSKRVASAEDEAIQHTPQSKPEQSASAPIAGATESNSPTADPDEINPSKIGPQQFSTFRPGKSNSRRVAGGILELRLHDSERFLVLGSYGIKVLDGEITIAGASVRPPDGIKWVHAPHCHAIPVLRCSEETRLELHPHPQGASLRKLERLSPLFRSLWHEPEGKASKRGAKTDTYKIICTSEDAPKRALIQDLRSHPAWNKKLAGLAKAKPDQPALSVMLCGPKSSGKSTFGRILGNRLLTGAGQQTRTRKTPPSVVVMELDPGQPEYTPAGTIALVQVREPNLSPSFARIAANEQDVTVMRCHSIASVSPASDPELYLECALDLFQRYQDTCKGLPLIINTPGWVLGTGLDLLSELVSTIKPAEVIYMSEDGPRETVEGLQAACKTAFTLLPSQQSEFTSRTAAHLRSMQALAYFHTKRNPSNQLLWNPTPLSSSPPLMVGYKGKNRGITGIISYEYQPPADLLAETINGSILCLVETEDVRAFTRLARESIDSSAVTSSADVMDVDGVALDLEAIIARTPEGIPYIPNTDAQTLDPRYAQTLGQVLLRGIDTKTGALQILTPIPLQRIEAAKAAGHHLLLVHGKLDSPGWAYSEDLYYQSFNGSDVDNSKYDTVEVMDEDTESDKSDEEPENLELAGDISDTPWIEVLQGHEKRPVGSRVWRVRRDLGRAGPGVE
ncbi:hypothetical protein CABS01_05072 [Colletotrichum abscissum]|uniref:Polynucleotide 5'-hydroxyl-kinase GRC3 n=1 Tax=Colletotrichum abscissum TaxID=1671311 RepID=A0A9P9X4W1_9PEZI|nr:uncharacterized protein CABS01_05072 [Colletotrichum abscissum]KAI3537018.1 hypothetical protein CABS02_12292 [Colletotrichum abscissum]KAK1523451.1 hypothetical protein CABS01_05072 [Colletotrichum abscissum]